MRRRTGPAPAPRAARRVLRRVLPLCACTVALTPSEAVHERSLGARQTTVIGGGIDGNWGHAADGAAVRRRHGLENDPIEESFGLVLIEAWMMGRPVIGASIPATRDLVEDGEDGLIVPPADPPTLADAILRLLASPETRARMGARGRAKVLAQYTTAAMIDAWESLLRGVAGAAF